MRAVSLAVVLLASAILAGCVTDPDADLDAPDADPGKVLHSDENITLEETVEDVLWEPNILEAPPWTTNMWWKIEMDDAFTGDHTVNYRVVTGKEGGEGGNYLVGMPTHGFSNTLMVLHIPGFGQVDKQTLGYELHDCKMEPLQFPLEEGKTWDTEFECGAIRVTVTETTETTAKLVFAPPEGGGRSGHYVYDAELRAISEFHVNGYGTYTITDHGTAFHEDVPEWDGQVTVPYAHDVIFIHGRIAGVVNGFTLANPTGAVAPPIDRVEVGSDYGRVSFAIILGDIVGLLTGDREKSGAGYYKETATAPDGEVFELEHVGTGLVTETYKHNAPGGTWNFEHLSAGPGIAMAEGIAYKVFDVQLPEGNLVENAVEHEHEDGQGHGNGTASR